MFSWFKKKDSQKTESNSIEKIEQVAKESQEEPIKTDWFQTLKKGLYKTSQKMFSPFHSLFQSKTLNEESLREFKKNLIEADLGTKIVGDILSIVKNEQEKESSLALIKKTLLGLCLDPPLPLDKKKVILLVGVNGAGKTTTCAKLSSLLYKRKPLLIAADTYRAAAVEQLQYWAEKESLDCYSDLTTTCPAAVVYKGLEKAQANGSDLAIVDTSGRLHTSKNLMQELEKIKKIVSKTYEKSEILTLLVLDAAQGQNMLRQVEIFDKYTHIDGLIVTKVDGTSKAGAVFNIMSCLQKPVYFLGCGEKVQDLREFCKEDFVDAIFQE